jgi:F-type H+-transporting ATPase subunit epsilon
VSALDVHVVTPEREVWGGPAQMVIARGIEGEVGILAGHAPLLIRLAPSTLRIQREDGSWETAAVDGGFFHVTSGEEGTRVDVLASNARLGEDRERESA